MTQLLRARAVLCLTAALGLITPSPGDAQRGWIAGASVGHAVHDPVLKVVGTTGLTLGLSHEGDQWFFVSAGVPFDSAGLPWAALGAGGRFTLTERPLAVGLDVGALGFGYQDRLTQANGGGVTAEAMPLLALSRSSARLELRSGVVHYTSLYAGEAAGRTLHQTDARVVIDSRSLLLTGESRYLRAPEGSYPYAGAAVETGTERVGLSVHAGSWLSGAITSPVWGVGLRVQLGRGTEAQLSLQQETNDPLIGNAPRRSWNAGVSHRLGRTPQAPSILPVAGSAGITFRLPLSLSDSVPHLAGDFTGWTEVPMRRTGDFWSVTLPIATGAYRYAFRGANGAWFVPEWLPGRQEDGFGGFNAVLIVP